MKTDPECKGTVATTLRALVISVPASRPLGIRCGPLQDLSCPNLLPAYHVGPGESRVWHPYSGTKQFCEQPC